MMRPERFVNRVHEMRMFMSEIAEARNVNRIVLLEGASGLGKSSFTCKLLEQQQGAPGIKVRLMAGASPDGYLIAETARAVSDAGPSSGYRSLQQYIVDLPAGSEMRRRYHSLLLDKLTDLDPTEVSGIATMMVRRKRGSGVFNADNLFRSLYGEEISLLADYLKHIFAKRRLVLNIENVQDADRVSLLLLRELLSDQNGQYLILEFTTQENPSNHLNDLVSLLDGTGSSVQRFEMQKLPFADVLQLISEREVIHLLEQAYISFDGNLRAITDLDIIVARGISPVRQLGSVTIAGSTQLRIEKLGKGSILTLSCIVAHRGSVKADLLFRLYGSHEIFHEIFLDLDSAIADLQSEDMVRLQHGVVTVAHDSVSRAVLEEALFRRYLLVAYEAWSRVYTQINEQREYVFVTRSETLFYLFHFYAHTDASRLLGVLDEVREVALESLRPTSSAVLLNQLREVVQARLGTGGPGLQKTVYQLLDLYYLLGLYEDGTNLVKEIHRRTPQRDIYHAALLVVQDRDSEAVAFLERCIKEEICAEPWYQFFVRLFLMVGYRCLDRLEESERVFREMLAEPAYRQLPAYGLLLRNADIVMGNSQAIPYLQESIRSFQGSGLAVAEAQSRIYLGVNFTIDGRFDEALAELNLAEQMLHGRSVKRHILLNDRATILLLRQPPDPDGAVELLVSALRTVTVAFDRIVVLNNLLIAQTIRRRTGTIEDLEKELVVLVASHPFTDLKRITYINLSYAWSALGSGSAADYYVSLARALGDGGDPYFAHKLYGSPAEGGANDALSGVPFRPAFLANWDTELADFIPSPH